MASTTNPILKYIVGGVVVILIIAVLKSGDDKPVEPQERETVTTSLNEFEIQDGDSTKDTINTLVANIKDLNENTEQLIKENKELKSQNRNIDETIRREIGKTSNEQRALQQRQQEQLNKNSNNYLNSLANKVEGLQAKLSAQQAELMNKGDIPDGLGFDDGFPGSANGWVMPSDLPPVNDQGKYEFADLNTNSMFEDSSNLKEVASEVKLIPVYTVPENSTLLGSTAMTGMIGRIPVGGKITDPYPFKIIVGSDDLATNGHNIPGLSGMMFSGVASGDLMLSCVSAKLFSVTYTFDDGTIRTIREEDGAGVDVEDKSGTPRRGLGWLSDEWGNPCIKGELITNAPAYLASIAVLGAAEGYATAYSENETTNVVSPLTGTTTSTTTGDPYKQAGGDAVANSVSEITEWLKSRQEDSFDAIFVPSGTKVAVHIETQLEIDYEPNGRKISYDGFAVQQGYTNSLD